MHPVIPTIAQGSLAAKVASPHCTVLHISSKLRTEALKNLIIARSMAIPIYALFLPMINTIWLARRTSCDCSADIILIFQHQNNFSCVLTMLNWCDGRWWSIGPELCKLEPIQLHHQAYRRVMIVVGLVMLDHGGKRLSWI